MLLVVGTVRLAPGRLAEARPHMAQVIAASRAEPGCLAYSYGEDLLDPGLIHIVERWQDRAALDRHFAAAHTAAWRAMWPALGLGERDLRLYDEVSEEPL